ncbi:MAG: hypothetical protein IJ074_09615 [Clostridia bacterium]|nr:hypothetical protein [Clostridia bacterium]
MAKLKESLKIKKVATSYTAAQVADGEICPLTALGRTVIEKENEIPFENARGLAKAGETGYNKGILLARLHCFFTPLGRGSQLRFAL